MVWDKIKVLGLLLGIHSLRAQQTTKADGLERQSDLPLPISNTVWPVFPRIRASFPGFIEAIRGSQLSQTIVPKPNRLWWSVDGEGTQQVSSTSALCTETRHSAWATVSWAWRMEVQVSPGTFHRPPQANAWPFCDAPNLLIPTPFPHLLLISNWLSVLSGPQPSKLSSQPKKIDLAP